MNYETHVEFLHITKIVERQRLRDRRVVWESAEGHKYILLVRGPGLHHSVQAGDRILATVVDNSPFITVITNVLKLVKGEGRHERQTGEATGDEREGV